jgi:hypothetical protein
VRVPVFEFEDFKWFPDALRRGMMDYLRYFFNITNYYNPAVQIIEDCLHHIGVNTIIDLCSGGGGPITQLQQQLFEVYGRKTDVALTDLYPNRDSCAMHRRETNGNMQCVDEPVDATNVPLHLKGLRTMFSSIHHFEFDKLDEVLKDAVKKKQGIAIFDIGDKNLLVILGILIFHPILIFLLTPFFRPFRVSSIIFTYFIPLISFCTVWDGVMSILRLYTPKDLQGIANTLPPNDFQWTSAKARNKLGLQITYLIGLPNSS